MANILRYGAPREGMESPLPFLVWYMCIFFIWPFQSLCPLLASKNPGRFNQQLKEEFQAKITTYISKKIPVTHSRDDRVWSFKASSVIHDENTSKVSTHLRSSAICAAFPVLGLYLQERCHGDGASFSPEPRARWRYRFLGPDGGNRLGGGVGSDGDI